jgi:inosine-uridine nucleoside N-ribohydrolase
MGVPGKPIDDGQTLLYLFGRPDIELVGITTTFGNGTIDEVHGATEELLRDLEREDIPLVKGEGERGQPATDAARFLAETVAAAPDEITLLAIGPLGNLWGAAKLDPGFFQNLKQIVVMGGYLHALPGSYWENIPELNLASDPEAAFAVLNAPCPVTVMNAHVCLDAPFGLPELARLEQWRGSSIYHSLHNWLLECEIGPGQPGDYLWDLLPAVYISYPGLFDDNPVWVRSTVSDLETGTIVLGDEGDGAPINMPTRILDVDRFYAVLYEAWSRVPVGQIEA